jgi:hypothetical protein
MASLKWPEITLVAVGSCDRRNASSYLAAVPLSEVTVSSFLRITQQVSCNAFDLEPSSYNDSTSSMALNFDWHPECTHSIGVPGQSCFVPFQPASRPS